MRVTIFISLYFSPHKRADRSMSSACTGYNMNKWNSSLRVCVEIFISSVMQHIMVNLTQSGLLLTVELTSDPEVWFKQTYTQIFTHTHTQTGTQSKNLFLASSLRSHQKVLERLSISIHSNTHSSTWAATHTMIDCLYNMLLTYCGKNKTVFGMFLCKK